MENHNIKSIQFFIVRDRDQFTCHAKTGNEYYLYLKTHQWRDLFIEPCQELISFLLCGQLLPDYWQKIEGFDLPHKWQTLNKIRNSILNNKVA